jgi:DNA-binding CsgD family transcriptional regulator
MSLSSPFPAPRSMLVGREREQQRLSALLNSAVNGQGRLILISGEAGIGKSALVLELTTEAATRGVSVLTGHCYDLSVTPPYGPWRELLARLSSDDELLPIPGALSDDGDPEPGGEATLFRQVLELLTAISATNAAIVVLEDLHWADQASLDLLRYIARHMRELPLLLIATYRTDEVTRRHPLAQLLPALVREAPAERIELRRLDDQALRTLLADRYGLAIEPEARLVSYLSRIAEGNPFYTHELLRSLEEERVLSSGSEGWTLGDLERVRVPALLQQVVDGRLARLGETAREHLAVAAVIGQRVALDVWQIVGPFTEDDLLQTVEHAIDARLLEASNTNNDVAFAHALVREVLYESILPPRRRVWHRRVAEVLVEAPGADPDAVAYHFSQAGDTRTVNWLVRAGERALRSYAWLAARDRFATAESLLEGDGARADDRGWLLYRLGRLLRVSDAGQGATYLEEAERVAREIGDPFLAAYALADRGMILCVLTETERGISALRAGVDALEALPADYVHPNPAVGDWVADALPARGTRPSAGVTSSATAPLTARRGSLALWLAQSGHFAEARSIAQAYLTQAAGTDHPNALVLSGIGDSAFAVAHAEAGFGHPEVSRVAWRRGEEAFRAIDHHFLVSLALGYELTLVVLPYFTTDLGERRALIAEWMAALSRGGGAFGVTSDGHLLGLDVLLLEGAWAEAERMARSALRSVRALLRQQATFGLASLARRRGEPAEAWDHLATGLPLGPATAPGSQQFWNSTAIQRLAIDLALDSRDLPTAAAWLAAHNRWLAWSGAVRGRAEEKLLWARYHRVDSNLTRAEQLAIDALAEASDPHQPLVLLAAHRFLGELMTESHRFPEAQPHLAISLELADACAAPFERALTLMALAELRATDSETEEAVRLLDEVRAIAGPLGATPLVSRADALSSQLAVTLAQIATSSRLSIRETEVLQRVAAGRSNPEIADELFISPRTVTTHLTNIYAKLGVESRAEAVALALRTGLI